MRCCVLFRVSNSQHQSNADLLLFSAYILLALAYSSKTLLGLGRPLLATPQSQASKTTRAYRTRRPSACSFVLPAVTSSGFPSLLSSPAAPSLLPSAPSYPTRLSSPDTDDHDSARRRFALNTPLFSVSGIVYNYWQPRPPLPSEAFGFWWSRCAWNTLHVSRIGGRSPVLVFLAATLPAVLVCSVIHQRRRHARL
ncbi:hypothetical protein B0H10DRAFT_1224759 [Mycena sp. CBHHK59/15]|nr:hypothetical protein B0H10DRAFT_1277821 [Mycena sp. CBHHK59/15]KAJ6618702.1 hypothetical protein B0H10DRAFT_1224759 [Mycena sp. CBHHK59/15]